MISTTIPTRPQKSHYSEQESAHELGLTIELFRTLIKQHITYEPEDEGNIANTAFQASDLLLLRFLSGHLRAQNESNEALQGNDALV